MVVQAHAFLRSAGVCGLVVLLTQQSMASWWTESRWQATTARMLVLKGMDFLVCKLVCKWLT